MIFAKRTILRLVTSSASDYCFRASYANLRVSLRKMRCGQRSAGAFERLGRHAMSRMRFEKTFEKIFHFRVERRRRICARSVMFRHPALLWNVWHGPGTFALVD